MADPSWATDLHEHDTTGRRLPRVPLAVVVPAVVVLATGAVVGVASGWFDSLIESVPGAASPSTPAEGVPRTITGTGAGDPAAPPTSNRAVYRDGTLTLEGTVPSSAIADAFEEKARQVTGAEVIDNNYVIDEDAALPTDGVIIVDEPLLFPFDSAEIDPQFHPLLDIGVTALAQDAEATIRLVGHADAVGPDQYNDNLSLARAQAVATYLIGQGVDPARVAIEGRGERHPIAENDTSEGRARNRRIEIELSGLLP